MISYIISIDLLIIFLPWLYRRKTFMQMHVGKSIGIHSRMITLSIRIEIPSKKFCNLQKDIHVHAYHCIVKVSSDFGVFRMIYQKSYD